MNNAQRYFDTPEKIALCTIEPAIEEGYLSGSEECLKVTTVIDSEPVLLGIFEGSWEFEEWLCSNLSYEEWRELREQGLT